MSNERENQSVDMYKCSIIPLIPGLASLTEFSFFVVSGAVLSIVLFIYTESFKIVNSKYKNYYLYFYVITFIGATLGILHIYTKEKEYFIFFLLILVIHLIINAFMWDEIDKES